MKLSTKGRHAVTAMMELALFQKKGPVTLADISVKQSISISYLEQLFAKLRQHGLVTGMRGPGGGYCLARDADEITIANILNAVDDMVKRQGSTVTEGELPGSLLKPKAHTDVPLNCGKLSIESLRLPSKISPRRKKI